LQIARGYARRPIGLRALAAFDLKSGATYLVSPTNTQSCRLFGVPPRALQLAGQIAGRADLRHEVDTELPTLSAAVRAAKAPAVEPELPLFAQSTPAEVAPGMTLEEAVVNATDDELQAAIALRFSRLRPVAMDQAITSLG
jgi:hypothetical protein